MLTKLTAQIPIGKNPTDNPEPVRSLTEQPICRNHNVNSQISKIHLSRIHPNWPNFVEIRIPEHDKAGRESQSENSRKFNAYR